MYFSTAVIAAFAATYVSASPLMARGNTCGATPAGSSSNQPISQPSGIQTSASCQTQCESNSSCKSFCFGMVDNIIQCKLYSCAASAVPQQSSTNLVVYDKACSAVPSVVPTSSNPTGKKVDSSNSGSKTNEQQAQESKEAEASKTSGQKATESKQADSSKTSGQKATESKEAQTSNDSNSYSTQKQASTSNSQKETSKTNGQKQSSSSASTCGTKPSASTNNQPISAPSVTSEDACKAKCQANSSCKSFTCGKVDNAMVCKLYAVAAAQVPAPSSTAQKNALKAYDVGCSI